MTHDQAHRALLDLAYGELAPEEAREVERHAADCAACAAELERIASTRRLAARIADEPAPDRMRSTILSAARRASTPRSSFLGTWLRPRVVAFAATAALVAVVTGTTLQVLRDRERRVVIEPAPAPPQASPAGKVLAAPPDATRASPRPQPRPESRVVIAPPTTPSAPEPPGQKAGPQATAPAARPSPAVAQREPSPEIEPQASRADDARPRARAAAPSGTAAAGLAEGEDPVAAARAIMDGVERRRAAGRLEEQRQRVDCGGVPPDRRALADGSRIVKLTIRDPDGTLREGWYDAAGRLRAVRVERAGAEPSTSFLDESGRPAGAGAETSSGGLPLHAPTPAAFGTTCDW